MTTEDVGRTAIGVAICRMIEQHQPNESRLFNDHVVTCNAGTSY